MNSTTKQFLDKLAKDKGIDGAEAYIQDLVNFNSATITATMLEVLTDEDIVAIEKIVDDKLGVDEVNNRFKLRTGMTPTEFVKNIQDAVAENYLKEKKD